MAQGIHANIRADGRGRFDYRPVVIASNAIPQTLGSARLRLGDRCDILVAVRAEITRPDAEAPESGFLAFTVDTPTPAAASGSVVSAALLQEQNTLLALQLEKILLAAFDRRQLGLLAGRHCWSLSVDALVLNGDGNLVDSAVLACRAALQAARLPAVSIEEGLEGSEIVLSEDPALARALQCADLPVAVTLGLVSRPGALPTYFIDPTATEEACTHATLTAAFSPATLSCCYLQKHGSASVDPSILADMLQVAQGTAQTLLASL